MRDQCIEKKCSTDALALISSTKRNNYNCKLRMHSFLLLPGKLESKIIPLKHLSQECISSSTLTDGELMRKSCTLMRYNVARKPFPFTPKKQLLHNWERKHHVLREDLHSGKEKISTAIAYYMVMFAMSPWRMYSPDMNYSTVSETNGLFYISW